MKTINKLFQSVVRARLIVAVAGLAWVPSASQAQEKGAQHLNKLQRLNPAASEQVVKVGDTMAMSCPKCKDTQVTVVEKTGKAFQPEVKHQVSRHDCPACGNKVVSQGVGKTQTSKIVHTCKMDDSTGSSCCAMKKGGGTTTGGMDEHMNHNH